MPILKKCPECGREKVFAYTVRPEICADCAAKEEKEKTTGKEAKPARKLSDK